MDNMNRSKLFAIWDCKSESFSAAPFVFPSRGVALRAFQSTANDPNTEIYKYPADFTLFEIGEWDNLSGVVSMYSSKVNLGTALEFVSRGLQTKEPEVVQ